MSVPIVKKCIICRLKAVLHKRKQLIGWQDIEDNDYRTRICTGFPTYASVAGIFADILETDAKQLSLNGQRMRKGQSQPRRTLGLRDEFLLTMLKLRQNHSHAWLAFQFNVSLAYVTRIIKFWIPYLALKFKPLIEWVPRADMAPLPAAFSRFPNTVAIIDCFELKIQSPSNPLDRRRTWSDYKQHMTSKHLIAIAPNGSIMYLSPGYSGRASDTYIVRRSEDFIGNLCEGDEILADKGFGDSIPYVLLIKKALLSVPVYRVREKQFTAEQLELSRGKSRVRIRVEDCIGQLRWFRILRDNIPITLLYLLDDMLVVIAAVTNMHPELGKKKSQQ